MTSLISDDYLAQQRHLHATTNYGIVGQKWADVVRQISQSGRKTILDYGCGRQTLKAVLGPAFNVTCYDPAIEGLDTPPEPADVVVCSDVLEHVEPECVDAVIQHISDLTERLAIIIVSLRPAQKTLADGRNAHISLQKPEWWLSKLRRHFVISESHVTAFDLTAICTRFTK